MAVGKRADLILLEANPLDDVANMARIAGVMVRGRWLPKPELERRLDEVLARHKAQQHARAEGRQGTDDESERRP